MRQLSSLTVFLVLYSFVAKGQFTDTFEGDRIDTSIWQGQVSKFEVDEGRLRLNGSEEDDRATIFSQVEELPAEWEWRFSIELDFNPSGQNYLDVWLLASEEDVDSGNGYYIQMGETGSDDRVQIVKRFNNTEIILASGSIGKIAESPQTTFIIKKNTSNIWSVEIEYASASRDVLEFNEAPTIDNGFFVLDCHFTRTRRDKFFFDDIYVGALTVDTIPPQLIETNIGLDQLLLKFSEQINGDKISVGNFQFDPLFDLVGIEFPESNSIRLIGAENFDPGTSYNLSIMNIPDIEGNELDTIIKYDVPIFPNENEILINEILFNPIGSGADYVEIINPTEKTFSLEGILISNSDNDQSGQLLSPQEMKPGEIIAITDGRQNVIDQYPSGLPDQIFEQDIPSFNNDGGNITISRNNGIGEIILDAFNYSEDNHLKLLDDEDGVSLERISLNLPTQDGVNWSSASSLVGFGTPGATNSINSVKKGSIELVTYKVINKVFSPFANGPEGYAEVSFALGVPSFLATARILDINGHEVRTIWQNEIVGTTAKLHWEGKDEEGNILPIGIYVLILEFFNLEGITERIKIDLVLADYLDK